MKATFELWRVLKLQKAYSPFDYGLSSRVSTAICISRGFAKNHFGYCVWVARLASYEETRFQQTLREIRGTRV